MNRHIVRKAGLSAIGVVAFTIILSGCGNDAGQGHDHEGHTHGDSERAAVSAAMMGDYIAIQETLAADSMEAVGDRARILAEEFSSAGETDAAEAAGAIAQTDDIEEARREFETVSIALLARLKEHGIAEGEYHKAHCPMAFGDRGASWVQADTTVNNPYYGATMLRCGEIRETFASTNGHAH